MRLGNSVLDQHSRQSEYGTNATHINMVVDSLEQKTNARVYLKQGIITFLEILSGYTENSPNVKDV